MLYTALASLCASALLQRALAAAPRFESVPAPLSGTHQVDLTVATLSPRAAPAAAFGISVGGGPSGAPWRTYEISAHVQGGALRCLTGGLLLPAEHCRFDGARPLKVTMVVEPGALKYSSGPGMFYSLADDFPSAAGLQFRVVSSGAAALSAVRVQTEEEAAVGEIDFRSPAQAFAVHGNAIRFSIAPKSADGPASFGVIVGPGERRFMVTREVTAAGEHRCKSDGSLLPLASCNFAPLRAGEAPRAVKLIVEPGTFKLKDGASTWSLYDLFPHDVTSFRVASSGIAVSQLSIVSEEEDWREGQLKAGASQSNAGEGGAGLCDASSASCGGKCWGVCLHCGPPRYCMCYPDGYKGVSGAFHPGAACLKHDGDGESVEAPMSHAANKGHKACEGGDCRDL
jgi:hypothetical protein